jgi:antitoxin ParD1/3/4
MESTRQFSVTLPPAVAEIVEAKIKSGAYASVSELLCESVQALLDRDDALEKWLREEVVAGHDEYLASPSKGVSAEDVLLRIEARRAAR